MFDVLRYLRDRRIPHQTEGEDIGSGWVGIKCPFRCGDAKAHGGFNIAGGYYSCWICGYHPLPEVIMALEKREWHEACKVLIDYDNPHIMPPPPGKRSVAKGLGGELAWPPGTVPLQPVHKAYLSRRSFDPDFLEAKYGLTGTIGAGPYAWRIMAPIFLDGAWVSYQGRDITGRARLRYKACKKELELVDHKTVLYNIDNAGEVGIIVEGMYDAWRLGDGAVATMGTGVTRPQIRMAAAKFTKAYTVFDAEPKAQERARAIRDQLAVLGLKTKNIDLGKGDPADMAQGDADRLKGELVGK